jgi:hypothetical protein
MLTYVPSSVIIKFFSRTPKCPGLYPWVVCVPQLGNHWPIPKPVLHAVRSSASSFNFLYPLYSLRSSSSCLRLLPRLPFTSILPTIFPWITCYRRQLLRKMRQIQLTSLLLFFVRYSPPYLFVTLPHFANDRFDLRPSTAPHWRHFPGTINYIKLFSNSINTFGLVFISTLN